LRIKPSVHSLKANGKGYSFEKEEAQTPKNAKEEWTVKRIFAVFFREIQLSDVGEQA
jgi:hypothetical protein